MEDLKKKCTCGKVFTFSLSSKCKQLAEAAKLQIENEIRDCKKTHGKKDEKPF